MSSKMSIGPLVTEFLGAFVFFTIVFKAKTFDKLKPFIIGIGLMAALFMANGHDTHIFNPAVTVVHMLHGKKLMTHNLIHIACQIFGAYVAFRFVDEM